MSSVHTIFLLKIYFAQNHQFGRLKLDISAVKKVDSFTHIPWTLKVVEMIKNQPNFRLDFKNWNLIFIYFHRKKTYPEVKFLTYKDRRRILVSLIMCILFCVFQQGCPTIPQIHALQHTFLRENLYLLQSLWDHFILENHFHIFAVDVSINFPMYIRSLVQY